MKVSTLRVLKPGEHIQVNDSDSLDFFLVIRGSLMLEFANPAKSSRAGVKKQSKFTNLDSKGTLFSDEAVTGVSGPSKLIDPFDYIYPFKSSHQQHSPSSFEGLSKISPAKDTTSECLLLTIQRIHLKKIVYSVNFTIVVLSYGGALGTICERACYK